MRILTSIQEAVKWKCAPDPYSYTGQIERLEAIVENQGNLIAELIHQLHGRALPTEVVKEMLDTYDSRLELE